MADLDDLFAAATRRADTAYAPYSSFKVGAAIATPSGAIFAGANVENAAYPQGTCAEARRIAAMVLGGERDDRRHPGGRRRRRAGDALRRLPPAHPRIRRPPTRPIHVAGPRRAPPRPSRSTSSCRIVSAPTIWQVDAQPEPSR